MTGTKDRFQAGTDQAANAAKQAADAGASGVNGIVDRVVDLAEQGRKAVSGLAGDAGHAGEKVQQWAGEAYDVTAEKAKEYGDEFTALIRKHPLPALLIGFGVGILTAKILRA